MTTYIHPEDPNIIIEAKYAPMKDNEAETYSAYGIGTDINRYRIVWATTPEWDKAQARMNELETLIWESRYNDALCTQYLNELEELHHKWSDESDACDWHSYVVKEV